MSRPFDLRILSCAILVASGACLNRGAVGGDVVDTIAVSPTQLPADNATAATVTVRVVDGGGQPSVGATVQILVQDNGAAPTITQPPRVTDSHGVATGQVVSATQGTFILRAQLVVAGRLVDMPGTATVTFVAPGSAAGGTPTAGSSTGTTAGSAATGSTTAGTGTTTSGTTTTGGTTTGSTTGTTTGASLSNSTYNVSPTSVVADGSSAANVMLILRDGTNTPISSVPVNVSGDGGTNTFSFVSSTTDSSGSWTATVTSTLAQNENIVTEAGGITFSKALRFTAGTGTQANLTLPASTVVANNSNQAHVAYTITDAHNNGDPNVAVTCTVSGSNNAYNPGLNGNTDITGAFAFTVVSKTAEVKNVSCSGGPALRSGAITFVAGPASPLTSTFTINPNSVNLLGANSNATYTVTLFDQYSNSVPPQTVNVLASSPNITSTPSSGLTNAAGVLSGLLSGNAPVTASIQALFNGNQNQITATVTFVSDGGSTVNSSLNVNPNNNIAANGKTAAVATVTVKDSTGTPLPNMRVVVTASTTIPAFTQQAVTDATGKVTASIVSDSAGPKTITARANGATLTANANFVATGSTCVSNALGALGSQPLLLAVPGVNKISAFDINSSGVLSLVASVADSNSVSAFLNLGTGTFSNILTTTEPSTFGHPAWHTVCDLNHDNHLDVIVVNDQSGDVAAFMSNGAGNFPTINHALVTGAPMLHPTVACGDFTNDGNNDVAVNDNMGGQIVIEIGNGDGTFGGTSQFSFTAPYSLDAGDLTNDGVPDLAVTAPFGVTVFVSQGTFIGTFTQGNTYLTADGNGLVTIGYVDLDGNTKLDVVVAGKASVTPFLGTGTGTLNAELPVVIAAGGVNSATLGEFNNDSKRDLLVTAANDTVYTVLGNGDGTFRTPAAFPGGSVPVYATAADFDGDGNQDVGIAASGGNYINILFGNGDGTLQVHGIFATASGPQMVASSDLNTDGRLDLVVTTNANAVSVLNGQGDGTFAAHVDYTLAAAGASMVIADVNHDGLADVINGLSTSDGNCVSVLINQGASLAPAVRYFGMSGGYCSGIAAADFNGDGLIDLGVGSFFSASVNIVYGQPSGGFSAPQLITSVPSFEELFAADFNADGYADLLATRSTASDVSIYYGAGNGTFGAAVSLGGSGATGAYAASVSDFNQDGALDAVVSETSAAGGQITVFNTSTSETLNILVTVNYDGGASFTNTPGDVTGDGIFDLAIPVYGNHYVFVAPGLSSGHFSGYQNQGRAYDAGNEPYQVAVGDFNGDGFNDFAVANVADNTVTVNLFKGCK